MKVTICGRIFQTPNGRWRAPLEVFEIDLAEDFDPDCLEPVRPFEHANKSLDGSWIYRRVSVEVTGADDVPSDEVVVKIKHAVLRHDKALTRMRREVEAFENMTHTEAARRERIPESARLFVWQRDEGKCVKCGSSEKLEFDHIIPVIKGGSNTERNIQLLCERCNRSKGADI